MQKNKAGLKKKGELQTELLARIYVLIMLCIFPLYLGPQKYILLTQSKTIFFFVVTLLALASVPILYFTRFSGANQLKSVKPPALSFAGWALIAFLSVTLIATVFSPYPKNVFWGYKERFDGFATQLLYGAVFLFVARYYQPRETDFAAFAVSSILVSVIGILQYYEMDFLGLFPYDLLPEYTAKTIIFRTTLGNIDVVSSYLSITVVLFGLLYVKHPGKFRPLYLAAGALNTYMLVVAGAEAGMVGALAAFALSLPFVVSDIKALARLLLLGDVYALMIFLFNTSNTAPGTLDLLHSRWFLISLALLILGGILFLIAGRVRFTPNAVAMRWAGVALIALILALGAAAVEHIGKDPASGTIYQARELLHGNLQDEFGSYRGFIWNRTFRLLKESTPVPQLLFGSGPDTFVDRFGPFQDEAKALLHIIYDKAHNEYLQILICQGVLGLISYLVFIGAVLKNAVKRAFSDPLLLACLLACVSYLVQAFFSISLPISAPVFWILLGVVALLSRRQEGKAASDGLRFP
ncbi:MAG TPA: O-antigen ligase family protein [Feifaniaceae bacterium]|nr:O-antigen ligase family protein [Feifaniaceae bacterium]